MSGKSQYYSFRVLERPCCVWGWDLKAQNINFLDSIDINYFDYVARCHIAHLEGEDAQRAATELRSTYLHGLETFFYILGATMQAPGCLAGWIRHAWPRDVRALVKQIQNAREPHCRLSADEVTWENLAGLVHANLAKPVELRAELIQAFGGLWQRFASDFLDEVFLDEYNSFKHGFRSRAGGFALKAGIEPQYGVSPPEEEMTLLGASEFGASFFVVKRIEGATVPSKNDRHFYLATQNVNWRPEAMLQALQLVSMSINNLVSYLRILHGLPSSKQKFLNPVDIDSFERPWQWSTGTASMSMAFPIFEHQVRRLSDEELLADVDSRAP